MKIDPNEHDEAIYCDSSYDPTFGGGCDIHIGNNANTTNSCSFLGVSYKHPQYEEETSEVESFLAGSQEFQLDEIEVYQREENKTEN
jgi:hypothetical protein